jgi:hypothetical protein
MKNIHLLPTEKPSRLYLHSNSSLQLRSDIVRNHDEYLGSNQHIYITSDVEIKEGDWVINNLDKLIGKSIRELNPGEIKDREYSKIILTTDTDLIKDGVQAIDDEFLEWFIKNTSCERVEVKKTFITNSGLGYQEYAILDSNFKVLEVVANIPQSSYKIGEVTKLDDYEYIAEYKIIIPKEKPKRETLEEATDMNETIAWELAKKIFEEIEGYSPDINNRSHELMVSSLQKGILTGTQWQTKRMYSEKEAIEIAKQYVKRCQAPIQDTKWLEQFKKKIV